MNSFKVIQVQSKSMRGAWYPTKGEGFRTKFVGAKRRSAEGEDLDMFVALDVDKATKITKKSKVNYTYNSENKMGVEHFNF